MLPDLPKLKSEFHEILRRYIRIATHKKLGVFSESPTHIVHEGESMRTIRADGTDDETDMQGVSVEMTLELSEMPTLTLQERLEKLDKIAEEMAEQMSRQLFTSLGRQLDAAGRTINRKGKPFDAQAIFEALEDMSIDFDENGLSSSLRLSVPPNLVKRAHEAFEEIGADPELRDRYNSIMEQKRREWRDREASRKLVG